MIALIDICLFVFLVVIAITIARLRNLFVAVMLSGIFSLLSAGLFTAMDAMDVAFTEAAVGAGISTVLMLLTLDLTTEVETKPVQARIFPLLVALCTGGAMLYATEDMPRFGDPTAAIHQVPAGSGWTDLYNHFTWVAWSSEMHVDNTVTSVLGSYRGYDTLGETFVVFTAALAVMMLLSGRKHGRPPSTVAAIEEGEE